MTGPVLGPTDQGAHAAKAAGRPKADDPHALQPMASPTGDWPPFPVEQAERGIQYLSRAAGPVLFILVLAATIGGIYLLIY